MRSAKKVNLGHFLLALSEFIDLSHHEIFHHQLRTAYIAFELSKTYNLEPSLLKSIFIAALFHDIGAISTEEKVGLHRFEHLDSQEHCLKGEILLKRNPMFTLPAELIRYHHTGWKEWDQPIENPTVIGSQILNLADYIERKIHRHKYILHQRKAIRAEIMEQSGHLFHPTLVDKFNQLYPRDEFWLDITSPHLDSFLLNYGPLRFMEVDHVEIEKLSKIFRDIIDFKSTYTATHSSGVSAAAAYLANKIGFSDHEILDIRIAANFHDIGKLFIPNHILDKQDRLNEEEFELIKSHTYYTYFILHSIPGLEVIAEWAAYHHEKINGKGYPFHCNETRLTIGSRLVAVADIFTALLENRPYRKGLSIDEIINTMQDFARKNETDKFITKTLIDNIDELYYHVQDAQTNTYQFYKLRFSLIREIIEDTHSAVNTATIQV